MHGVSLPMGHGESQRVTSFPYWEAAHHGGSRPQETQGADANTRRHGLPAEP